MPEPEKSPYDILLEDNAKMREELADMKKQVAEVLGMNRSLLGRVNSGSQDKPNESTHDELGKKLDGGIKHARKLS